MKFGIGLLLIGFLLTGCSEQKIQSLENSKPVVYAVNYPLAYFAERIAGDAVEVVFPEMEGDPAFWNPSPEQIVEFQNADLILLNGADYAKWVPKVSLPQSRMVNTSTGLEEQFVALDGAATHVHGPGGAHAHGDVAFTTWLNPELAIHQAKAVYAVFSKHWNIEQDGLERLIGDLKELDKAQAAAFQSLEKRPLLGSHPVYQYLARHYDLNLQSVHWEPDAEPDDKMWRELDDVLETHNAGIMLWEGEPLESVRVQLKAKGIDSVVFDPCGNRPDSRDYLSVMGRNLENLSR